MSELRIRERIGLRPEDHGFEMRHTMSDTEAALLLIQLQTYFHDMGVDPYQLLAQDAPESSVRVQSAADDTSH